LRTPCCCVRTFHRWVPGRQLGHREVVIAPADDALARAIVEDRGPRRSDPIVLCQAQPVAPELHEAQATEKVLEDSH